MNAERIALPIALVAMAAIAIVATPSQPAPPQDVEIHTYPVEALPAEPTLRVPPCDERTGAGAAECTANKDAFLTTRCWNLSARRQPDLAGRVRRTQVTVAFDRDGKVSSLVLDGIPADDGGLGRCLEGVIRRDWRIAGKWAGTYKLTLAFR